MMQIIKDPLEIQWQSIPSFGSQPGEPECVCAKDVDRWWIILKDVPPRLAAHIVKIHNASILASREGQK